MLAGALPLHGVQSALAQNRYASSDNHSGYVHWIELYDATNSKIDPDAENPPPYSPEKTCGRCHDYDTISHGWHFNAVDPSAEHGRPGQPWIWSDPRTGTHLPLSYRGWQGTHHPDELGLTRWQVAARLGGFLPGGGVGSADSLAEEGAEEGVDRSQVTGPLPIDCMVCHHRPGSGYSPFVRTEQTEDENFPYAPTAALGLATVSGNMSRLKDDFDVSAEDAAAKLPKIAYDSARFRSDGKVFFDLIRKPSNNACYYCHTNTPTTAVTGQRWLHDEDVHVRAGLACVDCHRNSIDHHTIRGYDGEQHAAGASIAAAFSCQGCHVGGNDALPGTGDDGFVAAGRLGAPRPEHRGLPPLHFEKMTCTACHSGPNPREPLQRQLNSIAHHLGEHVKRIGEEQPGILAGPILHATEGTGDSAAENGKLTPHRLMWPSFWGVLREGQITALNPETVYEIVRRPLRVRREFGEELGEVRLSISDRRELLGEERARARPEEWTEEERNKIEVAEAAERELQVNQRMAAALADLEEAFPESRAVFVSGGMGYVRAGEEKISVLSDDELGDVAAPYAWPLAHNVRPARESWGATGCRECHRNDSKYFQAELTPVGVLPDQETSSVAMHRLQGADMERLSTWNLLFMGRSSFKIAGLVALALTGLITLAAMASNVGAGWRRTG